MKKAIYFCILLCLGIATVKVYSQPVVTAAGVTPPYGASITFVTNNGEYSAGNPGPNQTWDLSAMGYTNAGTFNFVPPTYTECSQYFQNPTIALGTNPSTYYTYTPNVLQFDGDCNHTEPNVYARCEYSDPLDQMRFPMNINTNYTDSMKCACESNTGIRYVRGEATINVDGYGTLHTPEGIYDNVLRVHRTEDIEGGNPIQPTHTHNDIYWWIKDGFYRPIATLNVQVVNNIFTTKSGSYLSTNVALNNKLLEVNTLNLFPVPAKNELNIQLNFNSYEEARLSLFDYLGKQVTEPKKINLKSGNNNYTIDISHLNSGLYHLQIIPDNGIVQTKNFIISR